MNPHYEFACTFFFSKELNEYELVGDAKDLTIIGEEIWLADATEFNEDIWEEFIYKKEIKELEDGEYFVYIRGTLFFDYSYGHETGAELDGVYPDFDYIKTEKVLTGVDNE